MTLSRSIRLLVVGAVLLSATGAAVATVTAAQPDVQIPSVSVTPNETVTGESVTVETTVANLESSAGTVEITDVYLRTTGSTEEHGRVEDVGSISPGGSVSIPMSTTFESAGQKRLTAHVVVRDESGNTHPYEYPVYVEVEDPTVKAGLSTGSSTNRSGTTEVELTNFGNTELSDAEITATANGETIDRNFVFDVAPGSSQSAVFDTENVSADAITFTATYTAAGSNHTTTHTVDLDEQVEGEIRLTGVETTHAGTRMTIEGDAANVGSTDTDSVLVRIPDGDRASPVPPSGEYFVGAVEASEFATFELTGEIESETSSVPVEITYIVDGERVTTTQRLDVGSVNTSLPGGDSQMDGGEGGQGPANGPDGSGGGGLPLIPIGVVLAVVVVGIVILRWRDR